MNKNIFVPKLNKFQFEKNFCPENQSNSMRFQIFVEIFTALSNAAGEQPSCFPAINISNISFDFQLLKSGGTCEDVRLPMPDSFLSSSSSSTGAETMQLSGPCRSTHYSPVRVLHPSIIPQNTHPSIIWLLSIWFSPIYTCVISPVDLSAELQ